MATFCSKLKSNFDLNSISEVCFWKSEWETFDPDDHSSRVSWIFIGYRFIYALYFICTLFVTLIWGDPSRLPFWALYLTNWSYLLQTVYALVAFVLVVGVKWDQNRSPTWGHDQEPLIGYTHEPHLPAISKLTLILYNIVKMVPPGVTLLFWVAVYDGEPMNTFETASNYVFHAMNTVLAVADTVIVAIPVRAMHFVFGLIVPVGYLVFTLIYEVAGGPYENGAAFIYPVLNWKENAEGAALMTLIALIAFVLSHVTFAWALTRARIYIANQLASNKRAF